MSRFVLANSLEERTYFDHGDFAPRVTEDGTDRLERSSSYCDSITKLQAPIPAAGNVNKNAIDYIYTKSSNPEKSPRLRPTKFEDEDASLEKGKQIFL
ncbi:hypothetical protein N7486_008784 [Penicillium sp. IBT 16267x]|nr:hypothetical protein N7486_008784 [Penicillium sp. IBT 16267x]